MYSPPFRRGSGVPTTVLSLWQPLASLLAYGLQRVEGRTWSTKFRGFACRVHSPLRAHALATYASSFIFRAIRVS